MWISATWHSPPGPSAPATQRPAGILSRTIYGLIAYLCQIAERISGDSIDPHEVCDDLRATSEQIGEDVVPGTPDLTPKNSVWCPRTLSVPGTCPRNCGRTAGSGDPRRTKSGDPRRTSTRHSSLATRHYSLVRAGSPDPPVLLIGSRAATARSGCRADRRAH